MKKIFIIISFVAITLLAFAGPVQELMELAESAFSKGDYSKARGYYVDIVNLQSATDKQRDDARYNINVCQVRINDDQYNMGYNRALSMFNNKQFQQSRNACVELLKYSKYKPKTNRLIQLCNDSINARLLARQLADSTQRANQLRDEYNAIVEEALAYYNNKQYLDAIMASRKSLSSKYEPLGLPKPNWVDTALQIYSAQQRGDAITPEFARYLHNAIEIGDVNNNIARIVYRGVNADSTIYVSTSGASILNKRGRMSDDFRCGFIGNRYNDKMMGYYDTLGKFHSVREIANRDAAIQDAREFSDGMAPVQLSNNKWGYIDLNLNVVIKPQYDFVTAFSEGRAFVRKKGKWSIIDKDGKVIRDKLYPAFFGSSRDGENGYYPRVNNSYFKDGKIWIQTSNYHNILADLDGKVLLDKGDYDPYNVLHHGEPLYVWSTFSDGLYLYLSWGNKYGYMDASANVVIEPSYDLAYGFSEGVAPVRLNGQWTLIDTLGNRLTQSRLDAISQDGFSEGLCAAKLNGKWGYIDKNGNWIISPIYDSPYKVLNAPVGSFHNGFAAVSLDRQLGYVDKYGNSTFDFQ